MNMPTLSDETTALIANLLQKEVSKMEGDMSDAIDGTRWQHLSKQWFTDWRRRKAKLVTAQDEVRRISHAHREARIRHEQSSNKYTADTAQAGS